MFSLPEATLYADVNHVGVSSQYCSLLH
jgi:hypothetical protein